MVVILSGIIPWRQLEFIITIQKSISILRDNTTTIKTSVITREVLKQDKYYKKTIPLQFKQVLQQDNTTTIQQVLQQDNFTTIQESLLLVEKK